MTTRLFFALLPDAKTLEALQAAQDSITCKAKRIDPENLHMTLAFLGNCDEQKMDCLRQAAEQVKAKPVQIRLDSYRFLRRPQILACIPGSKVSGLNALRKSLVQSLSPCDVRLNNHFLPHVSLFQKVKSLPTVHKMEPVITWRVESFALLSSVLKPDKAYYEVVQTYDF